VIPPKAVEGFFGEAFENPSVSFPATSRDWGRSRFDFVPVRHHLDVMQDRKPSLRFVVHGGQVPARA